MWVNNDYSLSGRHTPRVGLPLYKTEYSSAFMSGYFQYTFNVVANKHDTSHKCINKLLVDSHKLLDFLKKKIGIKNVNVLINYDYKKWAKGKEHLHSLVTVTGKRDKKLFDRYFKTINGYNCNNGIQASANLWGDKMYNANNFFEGNIKKIVMEDCDIDIESNRSIYVLLKLRLYMNNVLQCSGQYTYF